MAIVLLQEIPPQSHDQCIKIPSVTSSQHRIPSQVPAAYFVMIVVVSCFMHAHFMECHRLAIGLEVDGITKWLNMGKNYSYIMHCYPMCYVIQDILTEKMYKLATNCNAKCLVIAT